MRQGAFAVPLASEVTDQLLAFAKSFYRFNINAVEAQLRFATAVSPLNLVAQMLQTLDPKAPDQR